jgi:hypothetical protein
MVFPIDEEQPQGMGSEATPSRKEVPHRGDMSLRRGEYKERRGSDVLETARRARLGIE